MGYRRALETPYCPRDLTAILRMRVALALSIVLRQQTRGVKEYIVNGFDYISMQQNTERRMMEAQRWAANERLARQAQARTARVTAGAEQVRDRLQRWLACNLRSGAAFNRLSRQVFGARASAEARAAQPVEKAPAESYLRAQALQSVDGPLII